jgi:hypothetical protein
VPCDDVASHPGHPAGRSVCHVRSSHRSAEVAPWGESDLSSNVRSGQHQGEGSTHYTLAVRPFRLASSGFSSGYDAALFRTSRKHVCQFVSRIR